MTDATGTAFLRRARFEAERYGSDPWVFVRELLQNARDAGAHRVWFETSSNEGRDHILCRDNGTGMTFEHAQRYLFSLYASSKRGRSRTAGRFGIGFWAVLRFDPEEIVVRSRPRRGEAWQVRLDGQLEELRRERTMMQRGTEVVLERQGATDNLEQALTTSVLRDAPSLRCRHRAEHPIEVRINGRLVRAKPALPPPSMSFRRRGLRGVVGLGPEPRAEIFAHGLRVRDAATLDELLVEKPPEATALTAATDGLAPRIIIDSRDLEVLMARGDAREDRALRRLVAVGHRELSRLVRAELDRHAHLSAPVRLVMRLREAWSASRISRVITVVALAGALGGLAWQRVSSWLPDSITKPKMAATAVSPTPPRAVPYRDLWGRYRGPGVDSIGSAVPTVDLSYRPADSEHFFAALWVTGLLVDGQPDADHQEMIGRYEGASCTGGCLEVQIGVDSPAGMLRIPIATGHVLDPTSVRLDDRLLPVFATATGQPAVRLNAPRVGRLRYRSGPGRSGGRLEMADWPPLPQDVAEFTRRLEELAVSTRAVEAAEFVRQRIAYDISPETAARHAHAEAQSIGLFTRAVAIGAGDCDVQNSLVAAMLDESGVPSRLAVGWIGAEGRARTGLHAWAEYRGVDGRWRAVDASSGGTADRPGAVPIPPVAVQSSRSQIRLSSRIPVAVSATLVLAALTFVIAGSRWRRSFQAGEADDIVGLLRGAAVSPRSFEQIHALFARRLLGLVSRRPISLARARERAKKGELSCGSRRSKLALQAARGGGTVLDLDRAESLAVADILAAVNLDHWQKLLDRAVGDELTAHVEGRLAAAGEPCRILIADNPGSEMAVLDGTAIGLGTCWTVVDKNGRLWRSILRWIGRRPAMAALLLADAVVHRLGIPPAVRQRCLSGLALEALLEAAEEES